MKKEIKVFCTKNWSLDSIQDKNDYQLLDTGEGEKLEKFGKYIFVRPYEDAFWGKTLSEKEWVKADGKFWSSKTGAVKGWKFKNKIDKNWVVSYKGIKFLASPTLFRHLGFFPEQTSHWDFIEEKILTSSNLSSLHSSLEYKGGTLGKLKIERSEDSKSSFSQSSKIKFLNLFGYTGIASLFALRAGAEVTHIDASKTSIEWAKENQKVSGLEKMPMRVICDDVIKFLEREIKRGNKYDAIIVDPPKFGRGPKGETWKLEKDLPILLSQIKKVLSDKPLFVIINFYSVQFSAISLKYMLEDMMSSFNGEVVAGELCIKEENKDRCISLSKTAIWENK